VSSLVAEQPHGTLQSLSCGAVCSAFDVTPIKESSSCCTFLRLVKQGLTTRRWKLKKKKKQVYHVGMPPAREDTEGLMIKIVNQHRFTSAVSDFKHYLAFFIKSLITQSQAKVDVLQ
jgi:hypothetical protein